MTVYDLLDIENNPETAKYMPGVLVATFYQRSDKAAATEIIEGLKNRMKKILTANEWLMGRLKLDKSKNEIYLDADEVENPEDHIFETVDAQVFGVETFTEIREKFKKYNIQFGINLVDKDEKLMKFGLLSNKDGSEVCVFISVSHVIADGHTLYSLYRMLDPTQPIVCMNRTSIKSFMKSGFEKTSVFPNHPDPYKAILEQQMQVIMPACFSSAKERVEQGREIEYTLAKVNLNQVKTEKSVFKKSPEYINKELEFVSTNDILVSWLQKLCPKADCLDLAVNLRGRIPTLKSHTAGNYVFGPTMRKKDYRTAADVRKFVNSRFAPGDSWDMPISEDRQDFVGAMSTNWATFYHHLELPGYKQKMHMPIPGDFTMVVEGLELTISLIQIIFASNKNETCMLLITDRSDITVEGILKDEMVAGELMPYK